MDDVALHPDFADLRVTPGRTEINAHPELFHLVNLVQFGGAADRPTHVPVELGRVGPVALWESTGADDYLPFWNTNEDGDAYLYIVHGSVRLELKRTGSEECYGHYEARTGDLFRIPVGVAHRTFSGDGRRRITLEIIPTNPFWELMGESEAVAADRSRRVGGFRFDVDSEEVLVSTDHTVTRCPRDSFSRALRALCAHGLHLGHNELDGGFVVHDHGVRVTLSVPGHSEQLDGRRVLATFRGLLLDLDLGTDTH